MTKRRSGIVILAEIVTGFFVSPHKKMSALLERRMRQKREARLLLVSELQRYNKGGESTAVDREGKWEVTEAVEHAKVRTLCVGEC